MDTEMSVTRNTLRLIVLSSLCGLFAIATADGQPKKKRPKRAPIPDDTPAAPANTTQCNYQDPQEFMIRQNFLALHKHSKEERKLRRAKQAKNVRFRTEQYGYFEGFGQAKWNRNPPIHYAKRVEFMGLRTRLNEKVIPALACVEEQIKAECTEPVYKPKRLSGIRTKNTYHNGQASNHVYGIALDIDPKENTCCMCVAEWGDHPLCQKEVDSIYERMVMPPCWVHVFERFGFYWLGRDSLQDTMHFEYLGDPDHILKSAGPAPHMASVASTTPSANPAENPSAAPQKTDEPDETAEQGTEEKADEGASPTAEGSDEKGTAEVAPSADSTNMDGRRPPQKSVKIVIPDDPTKEKVEAEEEAAAKAKSSGCSVVAVGL